MDYDIQQAVEILERTPRVLRAWLAGLSREWTHSNYGEDTFSPFDVVGHLIHGEMNDWIPRARIILQHGTARPFDKYDRYAQFEASRGKSMDTLLDEFEAVRAESLVALNEMNLTPQQLQLRGMHPALGEVTLSQLLATWVAHDLNHLAQIAKCMATQYEHAVGPWREYLGVLKTPVTKMDSDGAKRRKSNTSGDSYEWAVDYEQGPHSELWVYKFDHEPLHDGAWHSLNIDSCNVYRILPKWVQVIGPRPDCSRDAWEVIRPQLCSLAPLDCVRGCAEIVIKKYPGEIRISDRDATGYEVAATLNTQEINGAYERLLADSSRWE